MGYPILLAAAPGALLLNQLIPNTRDGGFHPHLVDIYEPPGDLNLAMCALHGGADTKYRFAAALGILISATPTSRGVNWGVLSNRKCALWVPQGQHCKGNAGPWNPRGVTTVSTQFPSGVGTWSDHDMWSEADDPQFVKDVSAAQIARYGSGSVLRILAGHSEGGMMTNRAWCEHTAGGFNIYCASSGPASDFYVTTPTFPAIVKPWYGQFGEQDITLQISPGHFYDPLWYATPDNISVADVNFPNANVRIGDFVRLQARVDAYNTAHGLPAQTVHVGDGVTVAASVGTQTTWSYCAGAVVLRLFSAADHSTRQQQIAAGRRLFTDWTTFALANAN